MEKLVFIYGGKSVEHDISIITALQTMKIAQKNYEVLPIYIDKEGKWWSAKNLSEVRIYCDFDKKAKKKKQVLPVFGQKCFMFGKKRVEPACVFVCCHGLNGEDGSVSAILQLLNVPYSCCSILSSALSMDKEMTKLLLKEREIQSPDFYTLKRAEYNKEDFSSCGLDFPVIVKPANLGSSVGIGVANNESELKEAIEIALNFDDKVLIEKFLSNSREFNCACFCYNGKLFVSKVAEVQKGNYFTFDEKYIRNDNKSQVKLDDKIESEVKELTKKTYIALECFGIVRVDFLYKDETLYVNEVNSIPGALSCYLFDMKFDEILDLIVEESKKRNEEKQNINYSFKSDALKIFESEEKFCSFKK